MTAVYATARAREAELHARRGIGYRTTRKGRSISWRAKVYGRATARAPRLVTHR